MRRADRLFQIVQYLRSRRLTTAAQLAQWLEVSERTVYRDIRDLECSGVPVEGEAGVGYRLRKGFDLPPIMFSFDEVEALVAGARMIQAWGSPELAASSRSAVAKIALALPPDRRESVQDTRLFAPRLGITAEVAAMLELTRQAIVQRRKMRMVYERISGGAAGERVVRPFGLYFWGAKWTLTGWCELRNDYRTFRLDRIRAAEVTDEEFREEPDRNLADFLARIGRRAG
ncbi:MAG: YafY family transcriptional regulator [Acidobacteriota bacterium]|nr:YafY family transcriptional regulator [Acidobacteriota bacterium]